MSPEFTLEETIAPGLRFSEEANRSVRSLPMRDYFLWQDGLADPISGVNVASFRQRFGAVAISAEGIGGVETLPAFRRRGLMRKVMTRALARIAERVPVVFLSDGINDAYEEFGFVNCLAESSLTLRVRDVERAANLLPAESGYRVRDLSLDDLPGLVSLYNEAHAFRPWTHVRPSGWNRLKETETWQPGSQAIVIEGKDSLAGYAIYQEPWFGHPADSFTIEECAATDTVAAQAMVVELAARSWELRVPEFRVCEPLDSAVGMAAQRLGCTHHLAFLSTGGMMGKILDREQLLQLLEPELLRRLSGDELLQAHLAAYDGLCSGKIIPDNGLLLRLITGFWSMAQASAFGAIVPKEYEQVASAWFPGCGTRSLLQPYSHLLDRY